MKHFSQEQWADFVRGVTEQGQKLHMQRHLDAGCKTCVGILLLWQRMREAGLRAAQYVPPARIVNSAKALQQSQPAGRPASETLPVKGPRRAAARLLFDSLQMPALGVRTAAQSEIRQLLYGAGDYKLDLRIEPQADSERVSLVGQVLHTSGTGRELGGIPVLLVKGRKVLATEVTSPFGEFQFECLLGGSLQLRLQLPGGRELWLPLIEPRLEGESVATRSSDFNWVSRNAGGSTRKKD